MRNPLIRTCEKTCASNPEQYEGTLTDGRFFYFRYRWGGAALGVGATLDEAANNAIRGRIDVGTEMAGQFDSPAQRDRVFNEMLGRIISADTVTRTPDTTSTRQVDLDEVMALLNRGKLPPAQHVVSMRNELCAWRAAHEGGAVALAEHYARAETAADAAVLAYRECVEQIMATFGFPQVGASVPACNMGGRYDFPPGQKPVFDPPCPNPATHRYKQPCDTTWGHRCSQHVGMLGAPDLTIESLAASIPNTAAGSAQGGEAR